MHALPETLATVFNMSNIRDLVTVKEWECINIVLYFTGQHIFQNCYERIDLLSWSKLAS